MLKVKGLKINYILNLTRVILTTLTGLIVFPYINRTLGLLAVGKYEYTNSIITYFLLFSSLGVPIYGIRQIARVRDNTLKRTKVVLELLILLLITTFITYILFFILLLTQSKLNDYKNLLLIMSPMIFLNNVGLEWFFQGIEDQTYITKRFILIKIISLTMLFLLVKDSSDLVLYTAIMTFSMTVSNIFNFFHIIKFIKPSLIRLKDLNIKPHLKGVLTIFFATISISIYILMDNTILGYLVGDKYVGLYSTSNKLIRFVILFITTLGSIMLPRLSYLYESKQIEIYFHYLSKSLNYILFFSIPISIILFYFSEIIINIMAGPEFKGSIIAMQILSPLVVIIGLAYFLAFMVLYPQGKEKIYTIIVFISAIISVFLNILLVPKFYHLATAWVNLIVESFGLFMMIFFMRKQLYKFQFFSWQNFNYLLGGFIMIIFLSFFNERKEIFEVILLCLISISLYFSFLTLRKDSIIFESLKRIKTTIKKII